MVTNKNFGLLLPSKPLLDTCHMRLLAAILTALQLAAPTACMAVLIPSFGSCRSRMNAGEQRVAERLQACLDPETILWYEPSIGPRCLQPDFVLFHPERGLLVLEIKDLKPNNIESCTSATINLKDPAVAVTNPLQQARRYAQAITTLLERDMQLVNPRNHVYSGRLIFPYGYGVVLTNISRNQVEQIGLDKVIEPQHLLCRDEMFQSVDCKIFEQQLWGMLHLNFGNRMSNEQVDRIRWHLFPEIRIDRHLDLFQEKDITGPLQYVASQRDVLRMMDLQQEQLARSLGDGHRVIHGVAGSGKTLILLYRAELMAKTTVGPILILCFNVVLAAKLEHAIAQRGLAGRVAVRSFHLWCKETLQHFHLPLPGSKATAAEYVQELFERVIHGVADGRIPKHRYTSIAIDEVHDFEPQWLELLVGQVSQQTESLLLLYDDAQKLYGKTKAMKARPFSFSSVGVRAQGRTSILRLNYRNTQEILQLAFDFSRGVIAKERPSDEDGSLFVPPETAGRRGPRPELVQLSDERSELDFVFKRCRQFTAEGIQWSDMAILYRSFSQGQRIEAGLVAQGLPVEWCNRNSASRKYDPSHPSIKLMTMHSAKGLEFPVIFIPAVDRLPVMNDRLADEVRLMYVAMTRAVDRLVVTHVRDSILVGLLKVANQS